MPLWKGNIVSVVQDGKKTEYAYDALGQLIRVDDQQENETWVYTYDQGGNNLYFFYDAQNQKEKQNMDGLAFRA